MLLSDARAALHDDVSRTQTGVKIKQGPMGFRPGVYKQTSEGTLFATQCMVWAVLQWLVGNEFSIEQPLGGFMKWLHCGCLFFAMGLMRIGVLSGAG